MLTSHLIMLLKISLLWLNYFVSWKELFAFTLKVWERIEEYLFAKYLLQHSVAIATHFMLIATSTVRFVMIVGGILVDELRIQVTIVELWGCITFAHWTVILYLIQIRSVPSKVASHMIHPNAKAFKSWCSPLFQSISAKPALWSICGNGLNFAVFTQSIFRAKISRSVGSGEFSFLTWEIIPRKAFSKMHCYFIAVLFGTATTALPASTLTSWFEFPECSNL